MWLLAALALYCYASFFSFGGVGKKVGFDKRAGRKRGLVEGIALPCHIHPQCVCFTSVVLFFLSVFCNSFCDVLLPSELDIRAARVVTSSAEKRRAQTGRDDEKYKVEWCSFAGIVS